MLGFALRGTPPLLGRLLEIAAARGAATILVADLTGLLLRPAPGHLLAAPRGREAESGTLTVPMAVLNALILTVAAAGGAATLDAFGRYTDLRDSMA